MRYPVGSSPLERAGDAGGLRPGKGCPGRSPPGTLRLVRGTCPAAVRSVGLRGELRGLPGKAWRHSPAPVTVAVKVIGWPTFAGLADAVSVVVVGDKAVRSSRISSRGRTP